MTRLRRFQDVAEHHLCTGCGTCEYLAPDRYRMVDSSDGFRRPLPLVTIDGRDATLAACPGASLRHRGPLPSAHDPSVGAEWGPVLEVWEGWSADETLRWQGSSGGVTSALALHGIAHRDMAGVLHSRPVDGHPMRTESVLSTDRAGLLSGAGSRYAPASPCDGLSKVEAAERPCVFVGKPCDVAGAVAAAALRPALQQRLGLTLAVFCAGTPSTRGTTEALDVLGLRPADVAQLRYRGHGWPGDFTVVTHDGDEHSLSYADSWGAVLQKHRQWRCMICPDHTGEFADLSVGDPWYREITSGEPGRSLVVVRTERGREFLRDAMEHGSVVLTRVPANLLVASQPALLQVRGSVLGRVSTMRLLGLPVPTYVGLPMARAWWSLDMRQKLRATAGTLRRLVGRGLTRSRPVESAEPGEG